jgi:hypothetical protein
MYLVELNSRIISFSSKLGCSAVARCYGQTNLTPQRSLSGLANGVIARHAAVGRAAMLALVRDGRGGQKEE